jgi:hypothetical protein
MRLCPPRGKVFANLADHEARRDLSDAVDQRPCGDPVFGYTAAAPIVLQPTMRCAPCPFRSIFRFNEDLTRIV